MKIEEILKKHFDWTDEELIKKANRVKYISHITDEKVALHRAKFYQEEFGLSRDEFVKKLKTLPSLLGLDDQRVMSKVEFYKKEFELTSDEIASVIKSDFSLLCYSEEKILGRIRFCQEKFKLEGNDLIKIFKKAPQLFGFAEETILKKELFFKQTFKIDEEYFVKMIVSTPNLLRYSEDRIKKIADIYQRDLSITIEQFLVLFKSFSNALSYSLENIIDHISFYQKKFNVSLLKLSKNPRLFGLDKNSVIRKIEFYKKEFKLSDEEFEKMFVCYPNLLCHSEKNIKKVIDYFRDEFAINIKNVAIMIKAHPPLLGSLLDKLRINYKAAMDLSLSKDYIIDNPTILTVPAEDCEIGCEPLKIRYAILRKVATRDEVLNKRNWFITSHEVTYARLMYLLDNGHKITLTGLVQGDKKFVEKYGVDSKELKTMYKIPEDILSKKFAELDDKGDSELINPQEME